VKIFCHLPNFDTIALVNELQSGLAIHQAGFSNLDGAPDATKPDGRSGNPKERNLIPQVNDTVDTIQIIDHAFVEKDLPDVEKDLPDIQVENVSLRQADVVAQKKRWPIIRNANSFPRTRAPSLIKPERGNNLYGRTGNLRCAVCRKRHSKVAKSSKETLKLK
jgi:hypothetical protein